ncbi:hypothetical protein Ntsu_80640 [Nocardia sp. IFM 10818]
MENGNTNGPIACHITPAGTSTTGQFGAAVQLYSPCGTGFCGRGWPAGLFGCATARPSASDDGGPNPLGTVAEPVEVAAALLLG